MSQRLTEFLDRTRDGLKSFHSAACAMKSKTGVDPSRHIVKKVLEAIRILAWK
jgi:hypothetical protein